MCIKSMLFIIKNMSCWDFGDKKQKKMKQQKNNYIVPTVKSVSFVVEVGSQLSETNIGKYSEDPNLMQPGTHDLRQQQSWTGSEI